MRRSPCEIDPIRADCEDVDDEVRRMSPCLDSALSWCAGLSFRQENSIRQRVVGQ